MPDADVETLVDEAIATMQELCDEAGQPMPAVDRDRVRQAVKESLASDTGADE